jgi:hypothetical protein
MLRCLPLPPEITTCWTTGEVDLAIRTLEQRIHDIEALHADGVRYGDAHLRNVEQSIRDTILETFGIASQQFYRYEFFKIDEGPSIIGSHVDDLGAVDELRQAQFLGRIPGAITRIRGLIDSLEGQRGGLVERRSTSSSGASWPER